MRPLAALLFCLALAGFAGCNNKSGGGGGGSQPDTGEMSLGPATAKVQVVEYASLGCPICAKWNNEVFTPFKTKYIDSGKVHYTYREFLTGDESVAAAGFLLAHCAGNDKYFQVIDSVYHQEVDLLEGDQNAEKRNRLVKIAESAGLSEAQFDACVSNADALAALNNRSDQVGKAHDIESTPTFEINGKKLVGYQDLPTLDKAIADAQAAAK